MNARGPRSARVVCHIALGALVFVGADAWEQRREVERLQDELRARDQRLRLQRRRVRSLMSAYGTLQQNHEWVSGLLRKVPGSEQLQWEPFSRQLPGPPIPRVEARVLQTGEVAGETRVLLSAGLEDEVEVGFRFSIYRANTFVGKVAVERLSRDMAACRVLFLADDQQVREGDLAATRLQ